MLRLIRRCVRTWYLYEQAHCIVECRLFGVCAGAVDSLQGIGSTEGEPVRAVPYDTTILGM
jgi:hypothetical protein